MKPRALQMAGPCLQGSFGPEKALMRRQGLGGCSVRNGNGAQGECEKGDEDQACNSQKGDASGTRGGRR
jgi:hypothetical protein